MFIRIDILLPIQTLSEIASRATDLKISQLQLVENIHDNKSPDIKPSIKRKIASFVQVVRSIRKMDAAVCAHIALDVVPADIHRHDRMWRLQR